MSVRTPATLKRILGAPTAMFIGMGVAIGSGIFRTPGMVAEHLQSPGLMILAWIFGGVFALMAGMVTAELATRFAEAGGEYVFLREAYGEFVAFFFGWAYTVFIIGGGAASIALAFGDFGCEFLNIESRWSRILAAGAIVAVTGVNAMGLRTGATVQNILTGAKIVALIVILVIGFMFGEQPIDFTPAPPDLAGRSWFAFFAAGVIPILWAYDGTTDAVKMAEEIKDVRRALPRALIASALVLTLLYVLVNVALMRVMTAGEMAGLDFVPGEALGRIFGPSGRIAMLGVAMLVSLGSLSSTVLATIRVTFALARDGLTFRFMSHMSKTQAPVPAFVVVAAFSLVLVLARDFGEVLKIYFFASAILFGLSYASLIVLRLREREFPAGVYRCPAGLLLASVLIFIQVALAIGIAMDSPRDATYTTILLAAFGLLYVVWKRVAVHHPRR